MNLRLILVQLIGLLLIAAGAVGCSRVGAPEGWSAGVVSGDTLFIGTMDGELRALDIESGERVWAFELRGEPENRAIYGTPAIDGDRLFIGGYDGQMYALDLNGAEVWEREVGDGSNIVGGPAVAGDKVLIGSSDGNLYAFDTSTGSLSWTFPTGNRVWSTPAVAGGVAYFGSLDHNVYAVNIEDGTEVWRFTAQGAVTATPLVVNGKVYVGAFDSVFYALDAVTGAEVKAFKESGKWFWGGAIADETTVYAPSLDGNLYALDMVSMMPRWVLSTGGSIIGSPVIVGDRIAVSSLDGIVRTARLTDGGDVLKCDIGTKLRTSLTARERNIFFSATDHSVRAIHVKDNGNPDEKWVHFTNEEDPLPQDWVRAC